MLYRRLNLETNKNKEDRLLFETQQRAILTKGAGEAGSALARDARKGAR